MITTMTKIDVTKENELRRREWLATQDIQYIPVDKVILTEPIHKNAKANFTIQIKRLREKGVAMLNNPIVVKDLGNEQYSLITGYKGYCIANGLEHELIPAVITDKDRKPFLKEVGYHKKFTWLPMEMIVIPMNFQRSGVGEAKVQKAIDYYKTHNKFDKLVQIKNKRLLVDGYAIYVAAQRLHLSKILVEFI